MKEWAEADFHRWADLADLGRTCRVAKMRELAEADFHRWADLGRSRQNWQSGKTERMGRPGE